MIALILSLAVAAPPKPVASTAGVWSKPAVPLLESAEGLPIGVQLVAGYGREDVLIRVAAQLEAAQPWSDRWPRA